jgi:hypothetical protein
MHCGTLVQLQNVLQLCIGCECACSNVLLCGTAAYAIPDQHDAAALVSVCHLLIVSFLRVYICLHALCLTAPEVLSRHYDKVSHAHLYNCTTLHCLALSILAVL